MQQHDLSGAVLDGRYQVIEPIAEGAMGSVYRGERLKLGRAVAIKIMHDALPDELSSRQRFEREAKLMARLEHPHLVSVIDFGIHEEKPFLVMDLVRGTSLLELLDKQGRFEPERAVELVRQVLSGLGHAHELGIVHRDIKPANIMLTEKTGLGEQARILDFGLARPALDSTKLTTGIVVGTPNYMAPEQIKGGDIDARTDLYAVGIMLFELLTGRKPFVADDPLTVVRKHLMDPPPTLAATLPGSEFGDLEAVVARALAKAPAARFASAAEMSSALEKAIDKHGAHRIAVLMAQAVPQRSSASSPGPELATMSGWNVPVDSAPSSAGAASVEPAVEPAASPADAAALSRRMAPALPASKPIGARLESGRRPIVPMNDEPRRPKIDESVSLFRAPFDESSSLALPVAAPAAVANERPFRALPLTRRQLLAAGGGLVLVIIIVVAATRGGGANVAAPADAAIARAIDASAADPIPPALARASDLYANGDLEPALDLVAKARRQHPDSAQLAFLAGKIYFAKLWWTDGIKAFRDAIRIDPAYRSDPELLKIVLRGFNTTPDTDSRLEELVRVDLGDAMRPLLAEIAKTHPNAAIRARATAELRRLK